MLGEKCGLFGARCFNDKCVFDLLYWGLIAQNHRGHESYGFLTYAKSFRRHVNVGLVPQISGRRYSRWRNFLQGDVGIAHVRYGTSGERGFSKLDYAQPLIASQDDEKIGFAFNGNIVNAYELRNRLIGKLEKNKSFCDSLIFSKYLVNNISSNGLMDAIEDCMKNIEGAFSVLGLRNNGDLFAFRDPLGIRPLSMGESKDGMIKALSSETVGLNINGLEFTGDVKPGEAVVITKDDVKRERLVKSERTAFCAFEYAYFARPDSFLNGKYVYSVREEFGRNLGKRFKDIVEKADVILSMPETAEDAAYGLHEETGLKWERILRRHRYVTRRAFILEPDERVSTVDRKINIMDGNLNGKRVIIVDDSIVRGDTTRTVVSKIRKAGAEKIYVFVTFPRITHPCFYGIDMATFDELIGFRFNEEEIAKQIGADGVFYQPLEDYIRATGMSANELCTACITGEYPTETAQKMAEAARISAKKDQRRIYERPEFFDG
ncbi:MAG: amidophosphoribosyltransferase [Crenarchaeota archaeon]|nr:amidophosphoribosyltransferase [Thermoproteota archaeon]MDW8034472.1 amidophosphoribosyltransferase [Nitrososphaerota archaeon]